jgi:hypothetical protein
MSERSLVNSEQTVTPRCQVSNLRFRILLSRKDAKAKGKNEENV